METIEKKLIQEIETAFSDAKYPGDEAIVTRIDHFDSIKLQVAFKGKHWKQLPPEIIFQHRFDLSLFTPEAYRFYLPAYLIAFLSEDYGGELIHTILNSLDPHEDQEHLKNKLLANIGALSAAQKAAIKVFIKYYMDTETHQIPSDKRIQRFWENYSD